MSAHSSNEHAPAIHYTDKDLAQFHADDFAAGRAVVVLMLSIFSTGVLIYSIVAYWVINFSNV
jgi:hypothetical protein